MIRSAAWAVVNLIQVVVISLWTALCIVVALATAIVTRGPERSLAMARRMWAPVALRLFGVRIAATGLEHVDATRPQVFVANHRSNFDPAVLYGSIRRNLRFLVKAELRKVPLLGWYIARTGMIFVDRSSRASARESLRRSAELLAGGHALLSFPEATRNLDTELNPFKQGIFGLAIAAGAEIVPVALTGTDAIWPPGGLSLRPGTARLAMGTPIPTQGRTPQDKSAIATEARAAIAALLEAERES